jgi:hypothetical protein
LLRRDCQYQRYAKCRRSIGTEWNDIRADMILAKDFKGQIRGWHAFMTEGIDALFFVLPSCF